MIRRLSSRAVSRTSRSEPISRTPAASPSISLRSLSGVGSNSRADTPSRRR
jgi:hypothetical protein